MFVWLCVCMCGFVYTCVLCVFVRAGVCLLVCVRMCMCVCVCGAEEGRDGARGGGEGRGGREEGRTEGRAPQSEGGKHTREQNV